MSLSSGMEEYYQKVIHLQEQLRQSEEERLKLEMKFNEMLQMMKEEEEAHFKKLRSKYKQFLDEDRRRQQRNDKILEALDRIENRTVMWEARTEKFKSFRKRYKDYLKYANDLRSRSPLDTERSPTRPPPESKTLHSGKDTKGDPKDDIVQKYLQSLSSQKCKDDILQKGSSEKLPPESKYSNLGNINSVYWKNPSYTEKTDLEKTNRYKDEFDSTQLKTTKDLENSLKQSNKTPVKHDYSTERSKYLNNYDEDDFASKKPTDLSKVYATDSRRQSVFSNAPNLSNEVTRRSSQHILDNGPPKQSPEQVHDELGRLLQQHKEETRTAPAQPPQKAWTAELQQKPIHINPQSTQQHQPISKQQFEPSTPLVSGRRPLPEYQPPIETSEIKDSLKDDQILNKSPEMPVSNRSSRRPSVVGLQKSESPYGQPLQRRPSIMEEPDNTGLNIQNERVLSQVAENQNEHREPQINDGHGQPLQSIEQTEQLQSGLEKQEENFQQPQLLEQNDTNAPLLQEQLPDQPTTEQDANAQPSQQYDDGQPLQQFDANGQPAQQYDENGQLSQQYYDENGQPLQQYDENGQPMQQYYDENVQPQNYSGTEQAQYYDENEQPLVQYDESGQPLQQYDENGQPLQQYDENGQPIVPQYNQKEQPLAQYDENGQPYAQYDQNSQPQYDENGQPLTQYDANGQPLTQYDANAQPSTQYDENGQPIPQYDANGQPITQYDENGQPLPQYDENGQPIPQYDANGQLVTQYDANGQPLQQYYDENGQPIQYYAEGESAQQYDENGQPIQQQYDENGQPIQQPYDQSYGDQQQYYDPQEQPTGEVKPNVMEMLETDTESAKQDTKVSNDSDFDFSNG